ncbi:MAG: hypothetical protein KKA55_06235 [Proteobacteria bacterium]|nr:hypothetical protein [Pseudomonadota bacterium]MBU1595119.1 hypothetical protein [Pseudomonadota bacterium]
MTRKQSLVALLACGLACLLLSACAAQNPAAGTAPQKEVQFMDTSGFNYKLSASLGAKLEQVDVLFPALITLNNIPERMDKWLSMVEKFGGKVEIQAEPEPGRGLITEIFSIFIKAFEAAEEKLIYAPAKDYNVLISYKAKTGIITKMAFVRKAAAQPAPTPAKPVPAGAK